MARDGTVGDAALLARLERYLDAVPRGGAIAEDFRSLTLFARVGAGWPYYARPTLGWPEPVTAADLQTVRERQRELGLPEAFEWVEDTTPSLGPVAEAAGLVVERLPLMVLVRPTAATHLVAAPGLAAASGPVAAPLPAGVRLRIVGPDDPGLAAATTVADVGFALPGTAPGPAGPSERDVAAAALTADRLDPARARMRRGLMVMVVGEDDDLGPLGVGWHQPLEGVTEIVGVATLPLARRRGLAAAVTARLVADALGRGISTVFLTAGSDDVARVYARVGFERVGTSGIAAPPP